MSDVFPNSEIAQLRAEIEQQKVETAALRDEVSRLQNLKSNIVASANKPTSRRKLLKKLALVGAMAASATALTANPHTASATVASGGSSGQTWGLAAAPAGRVPFTPASDGSQGFFGLIGTIDDKNLSNALVPPNQPIGVVGLSIAGQGVYGKSTTSTGVEGFSTNSFGVFGTGPIAGIGGQSSNLGVYGIGTNNGYGGSFFSANSLGILAGSSNSYGGSFNGGKAPIFLSPSASSFPNGPTSGNHLKGELTVDSNGILFACVADGNPGIWRKLAGVATAGSLHILASPERFVDTRNGLMGSDDPTGQVTGFDPATTPAASNIFSYTMTGRPGVNGIQLPLGVTAIVGNITVIADASLPGGGYISIWPEGGAVPPIAILNYRPGQIVGNSFTAGLSAAGKLSVASFKTVHVVIDVVGYYL